MELKKRLRDLIPGGAHTYSKGEDQFASNVPAIITRGEGAYLWDNESNKYLDCSLGLSSVSLGHGYQEVIDAVVSQLPKGVNFQRPSDIELKMAEKFLEIVPGHDMIKFAKNGSNVTTAAVKLARAYTKRTLVACAEEHPFFSFDDWFIGVTECSNGVPNETSLLTKKFSTRSIQALEDLFREFPNQIAAVIMEPERSTDGEKGEYLRAAIELTQANGAVFILDEMVTGFKIDFPGAITKYNLRPDIATWGKGIANGFSFCALTGKREIMELGGSDRPGEEKVFLLSSTHGAETISLAAAHATISVFETKNVIKHNHSIGKYLIEQSAQLVKKYDLENYIQVYPCEWMPTFVFKDADMKISAGFRTLVIQEMTKLGVLFQGYFIPCYSHTVADIDFFLSAFEETLKVYHSALQQGLEKFLAGDVVKPVFRKFN